MIPAMLQKLNVQQRLYQTGKVINSLSISRYMRIQCITSIGLYYNIFGIITWEFILWVLLFSGKKGSLG